MLGQDRVVGSAAEPRLGGYAKVYLAWRTEK